jgi:hypothetical protein
MVSYLLAGYRLASDICGVKTAQKSLAFVDKTGTLTSAGLFHTIVSTL